MLESNSDIFDASVSDHSEHGTFKYHSSLISAEPIQRIWHLPFKAVVSVSAKRAGGGGNAWRVQPFPDFFKDYAASYEIQLGSFVYNGYEICMEWFDVAFDCKYFCEEDDFGAYSGLYDLRVWQ